MNRYVAYPLIVATLLSLAGPSPAEDPDARESLRLGKRATALIVVATAAGEASGSAFCVAKSGLFVTNAHVVESAGPNATIKLILHAGEGDERVVEAKILRIDDEIDLALLKAEAGEVLTPLSLAIVSGIEWRTGMAGAQSRRTCPGSEPWRFRTRSARFSCPSVAVPDHPVDFP